MAPMTGYSAPLRFPASKGYNLVHSKSKNLRLSGTQDCLPPLRERGLGSGDTGECARDVHGESNEWFEHGLVQRVRVCAVEHMTDAGEGGDGRAERLNRGRGEAHSTSESYALGCSWVTDDCQDGSLRVAKTWIPYCRTTGCEPLDEFVGCVEDAEGELIPGGGVATPPPGTKSTRVMENKMWPFLDVRSDGVLTAGFSGISMRAARHRCRGIQPLTHRVRRLVWAAQKRQSYSGGTGRKPGFNAGLANFGIAEFLNGRMMGGSIFGSADSKIHTSTGTSPGGIEFAGMRPETAFSSLVAVFRDALALARRRSGFAGVRFA
ncbi:hypothetical protein B0H15DRAFT_932063 [Mycena belliarum]|uniref:Uncharacterized protein n=1 Tax=Mycena belliarum TaxID=1033014 RepID=A0AAD6XPX2_9AGAR|nr:hypothetical protein B0H15DRAFT_932063 [Mycena belliae]